MIWFELLWFMRVNLDLRLDLRDVDLQATERASMARQSAFHISKFVREKAYVVRKIKVIQMAGKAPYNTSFMQGQFSHAVVQDNGEKKLMKFRSILLCLGINRFYLILFYRYALENNTGANWTWLCEVCRSWS